MSVRIKEGMIPYTWWIGIEVTDNHVINLLLREANNLIHVNEDNEVYVDLQLDDGILPDADFPVGVTTGKILQSDWWQQSWLILNWKTTSWDYNRLIYANDWNVYIDIGDGNWILLWEWGSILDCNTKTFYISSTSDLTTAQDAYDWYRQGKNAIIYFEYGSPTNPIYLVYDEINSPEHLLVFRAMPHTWIDAVHWWTVISAPSVTLEIGSNNTVTSVGYANTVNQFLEPNRNYLNPFIPTLDWDPTTKKYVDDELALKQDILTAGNNITIQNNVISANLTNVYTYKWSVPDYASLPSSWQNVWDVYYTLDTGISYAWNWSTWMSMWSFVDLSNYFNKVNDDSDDITEWSVHLFCTSIEKTYWNSKQDALTAWNGITINGNTISADPYTAGTGISISWNQVDNTLPFNPDNAWVIGQILQKTSEGYEWKNFPNVVSSVNGQSWAVTVDEFEPSNTWTVGQVLKRTANGYGWYPESWWGWGWDYSAGHWINIDANDEISNTLPFEPSNSGTSWQVLKKTSNGYSWQNESWWWGTYTGWDWISIDSNNVIDNTWVLSVNNQTWPVTVNEVPSWGNEGQVLQKTSSGYAWMNAITDSNVKQWTINSNSVSGTTLKAIHDWVIADANNWAIIWDSYTNDVFLYHHTTTGSGQTNLIFYGVKRTSQKYTSQKWDYTEAWQLKMAITYNGSTYSCVTSRNTDDATVTNYLSVEGSGYTTPFIPVSDYQPTTKKYVDDWLSLKANSSSLGTASTKNTWTSSWNVPVLDSNWKLATSTLPWVALTDTFTVSTSSDLTSLSSAEQWDLAIVTSENKTYVLAQDPYSTSANWKQILSPTGWVTSVNWQTWAVTLSIPSITSTTATLTVGWWSSSTQTVNVTGVTATNQVIVCPDPSDLDDYAEKGIYCLGQGSGTLTFTCDTTPTASITVNVLIMNI